MRNCQFRASYDNIFQNIGIMKTLLITVILAFNSVLAGCSKVEFNWKSATQSNTIHAYQEFLAKYPDSQYTSKANESIYEIAWGDLKRMPTVEAIREFQMVYKDHPNIQEADDMLELKQLDRAIKSKDESTLNEFIANYPSSPQLDMIKSKIQTLRDSGISSSIAYSFNSNATGLKVSRILAEKYKVESINGHTFSELRWSNSMYPKKGSAGTMTFGGGGQVNLSSGWVISGEALDGLISVSGSKDGDGGFVVDSLEIGETVGVTLSDGRKYVYKMGHWM